MTRRTVNIIIAVVGVCVLVVVGVIAFGAYMAMSAVQSEQTDESTAVQRIAEVRQRFGDSKPAFMVLDGKPMMVRTPPAQAPGAVTTLHIMRFNRSESELTNLTLPFTFLRMTTEPIKFSEDGERQFEVAVEDVERYGPALLLDYEDSEGLLLVWSD